MEYKEVIFLNRLRVEKTPVTVFIVNGFQMTGIISAFDATTILLDVDGCPRMLYKSAVSTVCPKRPANVPGAGFLPRNGA